MRALIVDDEPLARARLRDILDEQPDLHVIGECEDGVAAVEAIRNMAPDVVFLDIQMRELGGFGVIEAIGPERMPAVVFVTAYDEWALNAFDVHAVDYLLKPLQPDLVKRALERVRHRHSAQANPVTATALANLLSMVQPAPRVRIPVTLAGRTTLVPVDDVDWIEADGNYVRLHVGKKNHLIRESLAALEARLDPTVFIRVHRSAIVNVQRVHSFQAIVNGDYELTMTSGDVVSASRIYRRRLRIALGLPP